MRKGLSSVYGFILVYLLAIASLQAISSAASTGQIANEAAQSAQQVSAQRSLEHLTISSGSKGSVTIVNDGVIPSSVSYLLLENSSKSNAKPIGQRLSVGGNLTISTGASSSLAIVTSLGNVFFRQLSSVSQTTGNSWKTWQGVGGPGVDMLLSQNPSDPSRFFVSQGPSLNEFSSGTGNLLWTFNAGAGEITDVLPLSSGSVYASQGYFGSQRTATLYRLSPAGTSVSAYSMRLLRLYRNLEVQYPDNDQPPFPVGSEPVQRGMDSLYAYYDGWFFSSAGVSSMTLPGDSYNLAAADDSRVYLYSVGADPGGYGCSPPRGNSGDLRSYSADSAGVNYQWDVTFYFSVCNFYPESLVSAWAGSGLVGALYAEIYDSQGTYFGGPYSGGNPFLVVVSKSGQMMFSGRIDQPTYSSITSDGSYVYLASPATHQVERFDFSHSVSALYDVGIAAQSVTWAYNSLFVISADTVKVYDSSMNLKKTLAFAPSSFYSITNSKQFEPRMISPSFIVLNSTSYVALVRNASGFGTLLIGRYYP